MREPLNILVDAAKKLYYHNKKILSRSSRLGVLPKTFSNAFYATVVSEAEMNNKHIDMF